jgi:hypothetical protein
MNVTDLQTELRAGKSVADVAQEKNVSLDTVVNALLANMKTNLTQLLQTKPGAGGFFGFGREYGFGRGDMHRFGRGWFGGGRGMGRGMMPGGGQSVPPTPTPPTPTPGQSGTSM